MARRRASGGGRSVWRWPRCEISGILSSRTEAALQNRALAAAAGRCYSGNNKLLTRRRHVSRVQRFTVSNGEMVLTLEPAEEGGYLVTSPFDPELITEADTVEEAFEMARDAAEGLRKVRAKLFGRRKKATAKGA